MSTFRILSFDGGGVRGALSARLLLRLTKKYPELLQKTQLFSGTSTGSFIALGLAYDLPPGTINHLYDYETSKYIFTPSHFNLYRPKYNNLHLQEVLANIFPKNLTLAGLPHYVFIPSFNVRGYLSQGFNTVFFNNIVNNPTITEKVVDAALSSSAAPTYFPSHNNFIDGGVSVNSPTVAPVIYVRSVFPKTYDLSDFRLLSLGTGLYPQRITAPTKNWGISQWSYNPQAEVKQPLNTILMDAPEPLDTKLSKELMGSNFFRLNPLLDNAIALDDYKKVPYLQKLADTLDLSDTYRYIERYFLS
ncbi:MAG: patatin-like phospholipase family protein [Cellulosilyticaceae bacterium]